ncbi:MAG: hypothetical protein OWU33_04835 [Firmicutes bacterium]|nr:hypothetical protein [Bacillota bacterium]
MARRWVKGIIFAWGLLVGASLIQAKTWISRTQALEAMRHAQMDAFRWHQEVIRLQDELAAINRQHQHATYVKTVTLDVLKSPVPLIDVEAALQPYTDPLLGMPLDAIKLSILYHLLQDRRVTIGSHIYRVDVKALLVSPDIHVLLSLTRLTSDRSA